MNVVPGIKIEYIETYGWQSALRGMRNPKESWHRADSGFWIRDFVFDASYVGSTPEYPIIGPKDLRLALGLVRSGREHRKFERTIKVWFDITLPTYLWAEFDTYKIGVVRNSCSTMHKLGHRVLTKDDFAFEDIIGPALEDLNNLGVELRKARKEANKKLETAILKKMKRRLPSGYLLKSNISTNYEALINMYFQRKKHKLDEWNIENEMDALSICRMIEQLPYMKYFIEAKDKKKGKKIKEIMKGYKK